MAASSSTTSDSSRPRRLPAVARAMMRLQAFLLRRNWLGALGEEIMVITVTGRKTGRRYATPIGYLRDGETIVALTGADGGSQWYRNVQQNPEVLLEIKGRPLRARAEPITAEAERQRLLALYQRERRANFPRLFGVAADAPADTLAQALATRRFVRFYPLPD